MPVRCFLPALNPYRKPLSLCFGTWQIRKSQSNLPLPIGNLSFPWSLKMTEKDASKEIETTDRMSKKIRLWIKFHVASLNSVIFGFLFENGLFSYGLFSYMCVSVIRFSSHSIRERSVWSGRWVVGLYAFPTPLPSILNVPGWAKNWSQLKRKYFKKEAENPAEVPSFSGESSRLWGFVDCFHFVQKLWMWLKEPWGPPLPPAMLKTRWMELAIP